jgi:hypothetical protein
MTGEDKMKVKVILEVTTNFQKITFKLAEGLLTKIAKDKDIIHEALLREVPRVRVLNK